MGCSFDVIYVVSNSSTVLDIELVILDMTRLYDTNMDLTQEKITKTW